MPGVVVALAPRPISPTATLAGFATGPRRSWSPAYAIMFFPLALVGVRRRRGPGAAAARGGRPGRWGSGRARGAVPGDRCRCIAPGLVAAFCLVFLSAVDGADRDAAAHPTGSQTLATQFWAYETNLVLRRRPRRTPRDDGGRGRARLPAGRGSFQRRGRLTRGMSACAIVTVDRAVQGASARSRCWPAWTWRCRRAR